MARPPVSFPPSAPAGMAAGLLACLLLAGSALGERLEENTLKAAMAVNIARFTEWPTLDDGVFRLCVYDPGGELLAAFRDLLPKQIHRRDLAVAPIRRTLELGGCQLLFIHDPERAASARLLTAVEGRPVLSIGDTPGFARGAGGIVNLVRQGRKLRFNVNLARARAAGLRISSRLLKLARIVGARR